MRWLLIFLCLSSANNTLRGLLKLNAPELDIQEYKTANRVISLYLHCRGRSPKKTEQYTPGDIQLGREINFELTVAITFKIFPLKGGFFVTITVFVIFF